MAARDVTPRLDPLTLLADLQAQVDALRSRLDELRLRQDEQDVTVGYLDRALSGAVRSPGEYH